MRTGLAAHLRNAKLVTQAQEAIDAAGLAVAVVSRDGRYLWLTPNAHKALHKAFDASARAGEPLPESLRIWMQATPKEIPYPLFAFTFPLFPPVHTPTPYLTDTPSGY